MLIGRSMIGYERGAVRDGEDRFFRASDPATGQWFTPNYYSATSEEVDHAAQLASLAFETYGGTPGVTRAAFLRRIAANIENLGETLIARATQETGLPVPRIQAETARTCYQLRLFAEMVEEGSWVDARIDRADPNRTPARKPDVRSMLRPLGPLVVFCASNFPLAFSVAGGDTASALAAGCPVIVKAHHAHPGTAELVGLALRDAARDCDLPDGVFSLLYGPGDEVGVQLVQHPLIKAGGFTGSRTGGRSLMKLAAARPEPIPFYAEMSSVNPIFVMPGALSEKVKSIATGLHASITLGAGQFCTNPGLVFLPADGSETLIENLRELMAQTPPFVMLTAGISLAYRGGLSTLRQHPRVDLIAERTTGTETSEAGDCLAGAALFCTDAQTFLDHACLSAEVFGPSTLLVKYSGQEDLIEIARHLEGQLTATIHATEAELDDCGDLIVILERKAGRLILNGFPTGVEVGHAMVHGGPFPATSDGRSTSVGTRAAFRFVRAVCYQDFADAALPDELKESNPLGIWRLVDGQLTR